MLKGHLRVCAVFAVSMLAVNACSTEPPVDEATSASHFEEEPASATCAGLPRLQDVKTPKGVCVGIVAQGIPMARGIAQLDDNRFLVTAWASEPNGGGDGAIWMLTRNGAQWASERLATNWKKPHGIIITETQSVFVAEPGGVFPFDPSSKTKGAAIIAGLPDDRAHWMTTLAYDAPENGLGGFLYVNKGSATDNCAVRDGTGVHFNFPCGELDARAQLRRYQFSKLGSPITVATGLRNSMALAVHPKSHLLLQGENGQNDMNFDDPSEELNAIGIPRVFVTAPTPPAVQPVPTPAELVAIQQTAGQPFGWPYCYAMQQVTPGYAGHSGTVSGAGTPFNNAWCQANSTAPKALLPPHSAPLGMAFMTSDSFAPNLKNRLVITYHGFAKTGHKLVVMDVDKFGVPSGKPRDLVWGWGGSQAGGKPMGKPVSVVAARDGSLMVTDDRNGMVLRVTCDPNRGPCMAAGETIDVPEADPGANKRCFDRDARATAGSLMARLQQKVIDSNCATCHTPLAQPSGIVFKKCDDLAAGAGLRSWKMGSDPSRAWVVPGNAQQSPITTLLEDGMGGLTADQRQQVSAWINAGAPIP